MSDHPGWLLYPGVLLRRAGFGVSMVAALADPATAEALSRYREPLLAADRARADLLAGTAELVGRTRDRDQLRALSKLRAKAGRGADLGGLTVAELAEPIARYRRTLADRLAAEERLGEVLAAERHGRSARVRAVLADDRVLDAVLQLSPSFHDEVLRFAATSGAPGDRAKDRAFYRRVYLYAQRLGAKNETTSFFGPLVHGRVDPAASGIELGPATGSGVVALSATVAFWAVCELAAAIGADPSVVDRLPVGWIPACGRAAGSIRLPDGRAVRLPGWQGDLVAAIDGERRVLDLASLLDRPVPEVVGALRRLRQVGAVRLWPEPPSTTPAPLDWLVDWATRWLPDTRWPRVLGELRDLADDFAAATDHRQRAKALDAVEQRFTEITEVDARRAGGRMYADRTVVSLDAAGDQSPVLVGGDVADHWQRGLAPVLDLATAFGTRNRDAANGFCLGVLRAAGVDRMPYDELIARVGEAVAHGEPAALTEPARELAARYTDLVRAALDGDEAVLDPAALAALGGPPGAAPAFASPDLMLERGPDGVDTLVLGELHPYVYAWGSQGLFHPDQQTLLAGFTDDLRPWGGADRLATVIRRRRHKGLVADWFPGRFVEITAHATDQRDRAVALTEVEVVADGDRVRLRAGTGDLVLYAGEDDHVHLRAFAAPAPSLPMVRFGDLAPRIVVGDVLVQRARWWFDRADLAMDRVRDTDATVRAVQRLRVRHGVPRFCFVHVADEPKPVGVDLDNPLAVDAVVALVAASTAGTVSVAEMRPAPDRLWLRRDGEPTTSEFRLAMRRTR
ncbi:hypothetical protein V5P93_003439 [Actinokineospora auranticolor]|uniref:Lantibiotic biosynthesis dehydratase-like protein n=1 Tax=Actinokineospora auranticolor TaxID=155976 RepID=A0A2S6GPK0_9PSEU|nr:lantibiotic dehydratase [Actinokineospora auranticolor]PPK67100.1 hypothetical protein CLV40_10897 [Actinokineospora auranticolor]